MSGPRDPALDHPGRDADITREVSELTDRVTAYRVVSTMAREGRLPPLIEIKGLGAAIASIKTEVAGIRAVAAEVNTEAPALRAELADVRDQLKAHRADLRFEAETLGNSGSAGSGTNSEKSEV